jgi:hypothetical protein
MYTSTVTSVESGKVATISGVWTVSMSNILINTAVFVGLTGVSMLLPPWRSARAQLHAKAHDVLQALALRFDAVAKGALAVWTGAQSVDRRFPSIFPASTPHTHTFPRSGSQW